MNRWEIPRVSEMYFSCSDLQQAVVKSDHEDLSAKAFIEFRRLAATRLRDGIKPKARRKIHKTGYSRSPKQCSHFYFCYNYVKQFIHIFILLAGIAGIFLLNKYWKAEIAFMKELADYHKEVEHTTKSRKYSILDVLSQTLDSNHRVTMQKDIYYLNKIDTITSKEKFYQLIGDSLSEKYGFKDFKDTWHEPPDVRDLYRNDLILASIDSMLDKTILGQEHHYELVIKEIQTRADSLKFEVDFFEVIGRDTPFIHPFTGEKWDTTDIEHYEAKVLEY